MRSRASGATDRHEDEETIARYSSESCLAIPPLAPFETSLAQHATTLSRNGQHGSYWSANAARTSQQVRLTSSSLVTRGGAWQVNLVLISQHVVNRLSLQTRGNEETDKIRNHEGNNDGVVLRRFKDS